MVVSDWDRFAKHYATHYVRKVVCYVIIPSLFDSLYAFFVDFNYFFSYLSCGPSISADFTNSSTVMLKGGRKCKGI
jgi:hypothetical protein